MKILKRLNSIDRKEYLKYNSIIELELKPESMIVKAIGTEWRDFLAKNNILREPKEQRPHAIASMLKYKDYFEMYEKIGSRVIYLIVKKNSYE